MKRSKRDAAVLELVAGGKARVTDMVKAMVGCTRREVKLSLRRLHAAGLLHHERSLGARGGVYTLEPITDP